MKRLLRTLLLLPALLGAAPALAQQAPWDGPRPRGMTEAHDRYAASALEVYNRLGTEFHGHPGELHRRTWTWQGGRNALSPLSNMEASQIAGLLNGRYFVYQNSNRGSAWSVRYNDPNGKSHFCVGQDGSYSEFTLDRYVIRSVFGLDGVMHWETEPNLETERGWPIVGNGQTGQIAEYSWDRGRWEVNIGWVQAEYAAAFAENCPDLPRTNRVNNDQRGATIQDMARGARAITGYRTAFENNPASPLTVGMFYWSYPPE